MVDACKNGWSAKERGRLPIATRRRAALLSLTILQAQMCIARTSIHRSGVSSRALLRVALLAVAGCFPRYGFAGGGLRPSHIRTMAIQPFDNETPNSDLQKEIFDAMRKELQPRLGVRDAPQERADALVRGVVRTYDADVPVGYSANVAQATTSRRKLQLTLDVQIIDQTTGKTLWERKGLRAEGEYAERDEVSGRRDAIKKIVNDIVEGAQSQW